MVDKTAVVPAPGVDEPLEVLKRVKTVEAEWDLKLEAARRSSQENLVRLKEESAAAIKAAHADVETARARALEEARVEGEREVAEILAEGERAAEAIARPDGKRPQDRPREVLSAVLGPFVES
jgi:vacuolar-type H+-ATPase subunit H